MKHLVFVDVAGNVVQEWVGDGDVPVAPSGRTIVDVTEQQPSLGSFSGKVYSRGTFEDVVKAEQLPTTKANLQSKLNELRALIDSLA